MVLFHAGVPWIGGGFTGVDIFFVISGYLITGHLVAERARTGTISIGDFYTRRIRRIAPALLLLLLACLLLGYRLLLPAQLVDLAASTLSAEAFASNLWFWQQSGYFKAQGGIFPLLHTWSLAIEEQFYIGIPLLIGLVGARRRVLLTLFAGLALLSLGLSIVGVERAAGATFYLLPTRAWELLVGSIAAMLPPIGDHRARLRELLALGGLLLVVAPFILLSEAAPFPGAAAIPSCLGCAAIILAGTGRPSRTGTLLSARPLVAIGLISYALYLWHWPALVFARQYKGGALTGWEATLAIAGAMAAAWLSWRFVEQPCRDRARIPARTLLAGTAGAALLVGGIAAGLILTGGADWRLTAPTRLLAAGNADVPPMVYACESRTEMRPIDRCAIGVAGRTDFALVGDSHAGVLAAAIAPVARERGLGGQVYPYNACFFAPGWTSKARSQSQRDGCAQRNRDVLAMIAGDPGVTTVLIAGSWPEARSPAGRELIGPLASTVRRLRDAGKSVIIFHETPRPGADLSWALGVASLHGRPLPSLDAPRAPDVPALLQQTSGLQLVPLAPALCDRGRCRATIHGRPTYSDSNHLSQSADQWLIAPYLRRTGLLKSDRPHGR